jgi:hypothetical protein
VNHRFALDSEDATHPAHMLYLLLYTRG